jgi:GTPase
MQFLRHVERMRLLVHLVYMSEAAGCNPVEDFKVIMRELASFSPAMAAKPMLLMAANMDAAQNAGRVEALKYRRGEICLTPREPEPETFSG